MLLAANPVAVEVLLVDADFLRHLRDVRDVDFDRSIAESFHELVREELLVLGLVRVTDDHLVDVGLRELLRLDAVLLRGAEKVVEERDVELQHLDELDDAAVRDVKLTVEVERARIGVRAVLGDLPVVDVAGELGRVLVLLVFRLERADADAVLLGEREPTYARVLHDLGPVAFVTIHQPFEDEAARRIELALASNLELVVRESELFDRAIAPLRRDETERLFVHRARETLGLRAGHADVAEIHPVEGVERAVGRPRVRLEALLQHARDRRLRRADRAVQQDDALLGAVAFARCLQHVHEPHERNVETEHRVTPRVHLVLEEVVPNELLLVVGVLLGPVANDHVVDPLERVARDLRGLADELEIIFERPFPREVAVEVVVLHLGDLLDHPFGGFAHPRCLSLACGRGERTR